MNKLVYLRDMFFDEIVYFCLSNDDGHNFLDYIKKTILNRYSHGRKIIAFYGECHMFVYGDLMRMQKNLNKQYILLGGKGISYLTTHHKKYIFDKRIWRKIDVLLYNVGAPLREDAPSLKQILEWISDSTIAIGITNAVFKGYMPQHTKRVFLNGGEFIWGDKNLNALIDSGSVDEERVLALADENYYSKEYVNDYYDKALKLLYAYEKKSQIKIADYIEKKGKKDILVWSVYHPKVELMEEIVRRIFKYLNLEYLSINNSRLKRVFSLEHNAEAVYPSVYKGLGIHQDPKARLFQPGNSLHNKKYSFMEYINQYVIRGRGGI